MELRVFSFSALLNKLGYIYKKVQDSFAVRPRRKKRAFQNPNQLSGGDFKLQLRFTATVGQHHSSHTLEFHLSPSSHSFCCNGPPHGHPWAVFSTSVMAI